MSNEIEITTKFCHPYMNFGGVDGCNDVVLKVPQVEAVKLQQVEHSKGETAGIEYYPEFFAVSFSITLLFWLVAKFGWMIIETIKRA
ncbi:hypothetical protein [Rodentibacter pneumotropicus]|uniref:hypothetical protein n=1 Tax=Rodentibacter pneumotropicus TaxID=758 RepID=UPI00036AAE59|nr:hypothetical protein [Rodentibacter pneumotropicus]NBH74733.1 hypothetical protein [Rodentibacter pneumotropicus]THA02969.1 hypothetical protein D3M73_11510 [Rodentibacter pneumotropicus]THA11539.1 hypothetical protein D3M81_08610 [Rodentibacter pneumotropicus]THA11922.1 hypothetical protein D3M82_11070 [Rodentibacter pneumotropicus]